MYTHAISKERNRILRVLIKHFMVQVFIILFCSTSGANLASNEKVIFFTNVYKQAKCMIQEQEVGQKCYLKNCYTCNNVTR